MSGNYLKDRLGEVLASSTLNGIDYVSVSPTQTTLKVHFLNAVALSGNATSATITGGETIPEVKVPNLTAANWGTENGRPVLTFTVTAPGDFSIYTLEVSNVGLDPFFAKSKFSFKANCPSDLDCKPPETECPNEDVELPLIDYLAKDFLSFRQALLDFSAQKYPDWKERSEADFGMMFLEALAGLADDLSYYQDRVAWEPMIETATERRSIVRLARLVDYEPKPAAASHVLLQLDVKVLTASITGGLGFTATTAEGYKLYFEAGNGLLDSKTGKLAKETFTVDARWNRGKLKPYIWDKSQACLFAGSTEMWIEGHGHGLTVGLAILIDTPAFSSADPPVREVIHLSEVIEETDPVFLDAGNPRKVTHLIWDSSEALKYDHPLFWTPDEAKDHNNDPVRTVLAGNLVPATHGQTVVEHFAIPNDKGKLPAGAPKGTQLAFVRTGPNDTPESPTPLYLYTLQQAPLAWLLRTDTAGSQSMPHPEISIKQIGTGSPPEWSWLRSLLNAELFQTAFTVDPAKYIKTTTNYDNSVSHEYDGDQGDTIRFGDGVFGEIPDEGAVFKATFRIGGTAVGNVARDSITGLGKDALLLVDSVTNPFAATGGADVETEDAIRRDAPQAFRAKQFRAVRREDYEAAAQTLPWVQRAGTRFRWTGSWLTVFTSADPKDAQEIPVKQHIELINLLNRYRMAGYESYAPSPKYISLDLRITICACNDAYRGDVEEALMRTLSSRRYVDGTVGFFHPDNLTFGKPLERSVLEAVIEGSYGVCGVLSVEYRRRGFTGDFVEMPQTIYVGSFEILQVNNDSSKPEEGTLKIYVEGGK